MGATIPNTTLGFEEKDLKPLGPIAADPPKAIYRFSATGATYADSTKAGKSMPRIELTCTIISCIHAFGEGAEEAGGSVRHTLWLPNPNSGDKGQAEKDTLSKRRLAQVWAAAGKDPAVLAKATLPKIVDALGSGKLNFAGLFHPRDPNNRDDSSQLDILTAEEMEQVKTGKLVITKFVKTGKKKDGTADDLGDADAKGGDGLDDDETPAKPAGKGAGAAKGGSKGGAGNAAAGILDEEDEAPPKPAGKPAGKTPTKPAAPAEDDEDPLA